jgi:hypothetical protein
MFMTALGLPIVVVDTKPAIPAHIAGNARKGKHHETDALG